MTKGYKMPESERKKRSETLKKKGGNSTSWKKGQKAWNFKDGKRLKRKFKRFNGKLVLNSHYVFCLYYRIIEIPKGFIIHHKDGNSLNDSIDNLVMMTDKSHKKFHNKLSKNKLIAGEDSK